MLKSVLMLSCVVVGAGGGAALLTALASPQQSTPSVPPTPFVPPDLVKPPLLGTAHKGVVGALYRSWVDWDTFGQLVVIKRQSRSVVTALWDEQLQSLSTAYAVIDVQTNLKNERIEDVFVAGLCANGDACIERWAPDYGTQVIPVGGGYVPVSSQPLPPVERSKLLRSSQYGAIRSLAADPGGAYVLFIPKESVQLYRLDIATLAVSTVLDASTPNIAIMKSVSALEHRTLGRMLCLFPSKRWEPDYGAVDISIVLYDDGSGNLSSPSFMADADWNASLYAHSNWIRYQ